MPVVNQPYIGFEGPIGAGKTTLAQLLALHLGATLVLEDVDGNAFLPDFYADRERWALGAQLAFLISRFEQLRTIPPARTRPVVSDYTQSKDPIFARTLLHDREVELYERLSMGLEPSVCRPDLTVYVDAKNDVLLDRIRRRNRPVDRGPGNDRPGRCREMGSPQLFSAIASRNGFAGPARRPASLVILTGSCGRVSAWLWMFWRCPGCSCS